MGRVYRQQKREYNIGEMMAQKRFIYDGLHVRDILNEIPPILTHGEQRDKFLDGLNKLSDENKELKQFKQQTLDLINQHICEYRKAPLLTIQMPMDCKYRKTCLDNHSTNISNKSAEIALKELKKELQE